MCCQNGLALEWALESLIIALNYNAYALLVCNSQQMVPIC